MEARSRRCPRCKLTPEQAVFGTPKSKYCRPCAAKKSRDYNAAHPEAARARVRRHRERFPELTLERARKSNAKRRRENPEAIRESHRRSRERYRDQIAARERMKRLLDPERYRKYSHDSMARNKAAIIIRNDLLRVKRAGAPGSHDVAEWKSVLRHFKRRCIYCDANHTIKTVSRDHLQPLCRGGDNSIRNIRPACRRCNSSKGKKTHGEFLILRARLPVPDLKLRR